MAHGRADLVRAGRALPDVRLLAARTVPHHRSGASDAYRAYRDATNGGRIHHKLVIVDVASGTSLEMATLLWFGLRLDYCIIDGVHSSSTPSKVSRTRLG